MDGTVADTLASIAGFGNAALKAHGYPEIETERYRRLVGNGADVLMRRMLDAVSAQPYTEADVQGAARHVRRAVRERPDAPCRAVPGIPALLRDVRDAGVKTAVLSNKPDNMTRFIAGALFPGLFDIVHGQRAGVPKSRTRPPCSRSAKRSACGPRNASMSATAASICRPARTPACRLRVSHGLPRRRRAAAERRRPPRRRRRGTPPPDPVSRRAAVGSPRGALRSL